MVYIHGTDDDDDEKNDMFRYRCASFIRSFLIITSVIFLNFFFICSVICFVCNFFRNMTYTNGILMYNGEEKK